MILLLGGTSEAGPIATALAAAGLRVLVSAATELAGSARASELVSLRSGPLDADGLCALVRERGARAVVDATHPYAAEASANARRAAARAGVPLLRYVRPPALAPVDGAQSAPDHEAAARLAFALGRPVLLTVGTRHLAPYVAEARRTSLPLVVRVLDAPQSLEACAAAGLPRERVVAGRGPYSTEDTAQVIRSHRIGVLVLKDGGREGGVAERLEAARREGCAVVAVARPREEAPADSVSMSIGELVAACLRATGRGPVDSVGRRRDTPPR